jgi:hypothetical protein
MNTNHAKTLDSYSKKPIWWWHEYPAVGQRSPLGLVDSHGERGISSLAETPVLFSTFLSFKMRPKNQNLKLQKRYLEVSRSTREEVRAFFHFTDKRKN